MAGNDCRVRAFQTSVESSQLPVAWSKWKRDLESYFEAENIVSQYQRKAKLLYLGGPDLRDIFDNLPDVDNVPHVLVDPPYYDTAISKLDAHFEPFRRRTYERHQFRQIAQKPTERFSDFVLRLRTQVKRCEYSQPDEMVVDQIVEKCTSNKLRQKLLKRDMFLDEVEALGTSLEESERQLKEFNRVPHESINRLSFRNQNHGHPSSFSNRQGVPKIPYQWTNNRYSYSRGGLNQSRSEPVCFACGKKGHVKGAEGCPASRAQCLKCRGFGHFARQCLKRPNNDQRGPVPVKRIRAVHEKDEQNKDDDGYIFYAMGRNTFMFQIGDVEVPMVIDSGAAANIISITVWEEMKRLGAKVSNMSTMVDKDFTSYASTKPMEILGSFTATVQGGGRRTEATFYVAKKGQQCLLGDQTAKELSVLKVGFDVGNVEQQQEFTKFKGVVVEIPIDEEVQPVQQPYRRVPFALEEKVEEKLRMMLAQGIIERVRGPSRWVSPMVPVLKDSGEIRLCIDMRRANQAIIRETHPLPTVEELLGSVSGATVFSKLDVKDAYHQLEISEKSRTITTFITKSGLFR
ncbi:uncharacterized protein LOC134289752 [Aedes albopictus]|uniref:CCHC-type domain-containing protein n=1 Tax=Aedes albopictus TaxID=7160 RepID=A0ABM1ZTN9_AEDAL